MATTIKLKTGYGVPPNGSLVAGEIAVDLNTSLLYTSTDGSSVVEVSGTDYEWAISVVEEDLANALAKAQSTDPQNYPYYFTFPNNELQKSEMERMAKSKTIGYGGGTWWSRPCIMGRSEQNADVVYMGTTYGSSEDRDNGNISNNKQRGEAVVTLTRIVDDGVDVAFKKRGINDYNISMREDEHHQVSMMFNRTNGQLMTTWGSRAANETQDGVADGQNAYIRYGQDIDSLSVSEKQTYDGVANYAQWSWFGRTAFLFRRISTNRWDLSTGTGGQNFDEPSTVLTSTNNYCYLASAFTEPQYAGYDAYDAADNEWSYKQRLHVFNANHPTSDGNGTIRYGKGLFLTQGSTLPAGQTSYGLHILTPSDDASLGRWLTDGNSDTIAETDLETVYQAPTGSSVRLLDVQYGQVPRALFAEFVFDWEHGETVPYGTTWDLKVVQFNEFTKTWDTPVTIASNLRGAMGYQPSQAALSTEGLPTSESGQEGYTSFYVFGASFYRGVNSYDMRPVIYYCDRDGANEAKHRLIEVTLNDDYSGVASTRTLLDNSAEILHRPEMALYGNKRFLMYQAAKGWSSFRSWVGETKWIDLTEDFAAEAPIITQDIADFNATDGVAKVIGIDSISPAGSKMSWAWEYSDDSGSTWNAASQTDPYITLNPLTAQSGRQFRCTVTNDVGSTVSSVATMTVA